MFDLRSNFPAQLSIPEILQLSAYSHFAILIGIAIPRFALG
jgi:hypothetical protein